MTKRLKIKLSRILSFKSCRSKDPSDLPFNPVRQNPSPAAAVTTTVAKRRRSSFRLKLFGCGSCRRRTSTPSDISRKNSPSFSPPHTPTIQWESEGKWHVVEYETPRRKIYDGKPEKNEPRRSGRYARRRGSISSAEEYEEETERESLLPSSANLSPENSSSEVKSVTRRGRQKKSLVGEESESSSPARVMPCRAEVVEGVAVVKRSEDPYEDFKGSMMEMIVEKKMCQVAELEQLLRCFLTLNAKRHHRAIVNAFSEVWVALFSGGNGNDGGSRRSSVRLSDYDDC